MNKLINFLTIQTTILTEFKPQEEINLAAIITTLCCILIVFFLILFRICNRKNLSIKKFIMGNIIFWTIILISNILLLTGNNSPIVKMPNEYTETIELQENKDYKLVEINAINGTTILIKFENETTSFEYSYELYNKQNELIYADNNIFKNIKSNEWREIKIEDPIPAQIIKSGGSYRFKYKAFKVKMYKNNLKIEGLEPLIISSIIGLAIAIIIPMLTLHKNKPERKEE